MKVYLVYWCNNESYEDYYEGIRAVFSTEEGAKSYITARGCKPHVCTSEWEKKHLVNRFDSEPDEFGEYSSMWVREMEVDKLVSEKGASDELR